MREIRLPQEAVDADRVPFAQADGIVDEARPDVLAHDVGRALVGIDVVLERELTVGLPHLVHPHQRVGNPADAALGVGDLELRVTLEHRRHRQFTHRVEQRHAEHRGDGRLRRVRGDVRKHPRSTEVHAQRHPRLGGRGEGGVPVRRVERGQPETCGRVGEGDAVGALGGAAFDLDRALGLVPQGQDDQGDVAVRRCRHPLVEQEVVVRLDAEQGQLLVLGEDELVAAEPGKARERRLGPDPVGVHVVETGDGVPRPPQDLVVP